MNWFEKIKLLQVHKKTHNTIMNDVTNWKGFFREFYSRLTSMDLTSFGAQLAFYFLLALFPLLIFIMALLPYFSISEAGLMQFASSYVPEEIFLLIENTLQEIIFIRNGKWLSIGLIATIWSASSGMNALIRSINRSYDLVETRPFIVARAISFVLTILFVFLLLMALVLSVFGKHIGFVMFEYIGYENNFLEAWGRIRSFLPPLMMFGVFMFLYWVAPNRKLFISSVIIGAVFATIGWLIVSMGFSFYISTFSNFSATYGSIGVIIIMMLWLYILSMMVMIGGQLNAIMQLRHEKMVERKL